jgi:pleiotropic regulator 1
MEAIEAVEPQSLKKRALDLFSPQLAPPDSESKKIRVNYKVNAEYGGGIKESTANSATKNQSQEAGLALLPGLVSTSGSSESRGDSTAPSSRMERMASKWPRPDWHAPWKNYRVISGHLGWVTSVAVDPSNTWFATGSADRTIKIWDLATGVLKLTLTGHIEQVRGEKPKV